MMELGGDEKGGKIGDEEKPDDEIHDDELNPRQKNNGKLDFLTSAYMKKLHINEHGIKKDDK